MFTPFSFNTLSIQVRCTIFLILHRFGHYINKVELMPHYEYLLRLRNDYINKFIFIYIY